MGDVNCKLHVGAERLKTSIILLMEEFGEEECKLQHMRDSEFELDWNRGLKRL
jgi:hypothetical protein